MKNIELANICYKYINNSITLNELIDSLEKIKFKKNEMEEAEKLIKELKHVSNTTKNIEDDFVKSKKKKIKMFLDKLNKIPDKSIVKGIKQSIDSLEKDYSKEFDSYERFMAGYKIVLKSKIFDSTMDSLDDYNMLKFIGQFIQAPNPPKLNQKGFDKLVKVGIKKDERELLWRLAFNYEESQIDISKITNYFIKKKDGYYLGELISAVGNKLDIDKLIDTINDKELIEDLKERKSIISNYMSEEQFNRLISKIDQ